MGEIDGDTQLVHDPDGITAEERETCFLRFEAAIAKRIPEVVGELHDPKPEPPEEIEAVEIVSHRPRVLPTHDEADPPLRSGTIKVSRRLNVKPRRIGLIDYAMPARDLSAGLGEVSLEMAGRNIKRIDATSLQVGDITIAVIDEAIDD
jgi:hypothetical protein